MLKKTMTYTDYNGESRTEDFYFNLTKAEIIEMEFEEVGGLTEMIEKITASKDAQKIMKTFKTLILKAYGQKSADGRRLMKSPELSKEFTETEAYNDLMMELYMDAEKAAAFFNAIVPQISDVPTATVTPIS